MRDAVASSVSSEEPRDLLRVDTGRAQCGAGPGEQEGGDRRVQLATQDLPAPPVHLGTERTVHDGLVRGAVEQAAPPVLYLRSSGSTGSGSRRLYSELEQDPQEISDVFKHLVCVSSDVQQGMRQDGEPGHHVKSGLDRGGSALVEARLAHQLTAISDRLWPKLVP